MPNTTLHARLFYNTRAPFFYSTAARIYKSDFLRRNCGGIRPLTSARNFPLGGICATETKILRAKDTSELPETKPIGVNYLIHAYAYYQLHSLFLIICYHFICITWKHGGMSRFGDVPKASLEIMLFPTRAERRTGKTRSQTKSVIEHLFM